MRKWLSIAVCALILAACSTNNDLSSPSIEQGKNENDDVQSLVDFTEDDKFASFIYSQTGTSYLLLNAPGNIAVELEPKDEVLTIQISQQDDGTPEEIEDVVYAIQLDKEYETIHIFEDNEEIPFEIWYE